MYELVATACAGLASGAGIHAALVGSHCPSDHTRTNVSYHRRTRWLNLLLASSSVWCAIAAYQVGALIFLIIVTHTA